MYCTDQKGVMGKVITETTELKTLLSSSGRKVGYMLNVRKKDVLVLP